MVRSIMTIGHKSYDSSIPVRTSTVVNRTFASRLPAMQKSRYRDFEIEPRYWILDETWYEQRRIWLTSPVSRIVIAIRDVR